MTEKSVLLQPRTLICSTCGQGITYSDNQARAPDTGNPIPNALVTEATVACSNPSCTEFNVNILFQFPSMTGKVV